MILAEVVLTIGVIWLDGMVDEFDIIFCETNLHMRVLMDIALALLLSFAKLFFN